MFAVVAEEVGQLLPVDSAALCRYEPDGALTFVSRGPIIRLVGPVLAEQDDEWTESRRCMGPEILAACRKAAGRNETDVTDDAGLTIEAIPA